MHFLKAITLVMMLSLVHCSKGEDTIVHKRDKEFFDQFENPAALETQAESKISELKVLQTDANYPLRFVLFDNYKFYYQIDKLGNGYGNWHHFNGGLQLVAERTYFDLNLYISAAQAEGNDVLVKFADRNSLHTLKMDHRNPLEQSKNGHPPSPLPEFTKSDKDI
jgi:hypothetical protein